MTGSDFALADLLAAYRKIPGATGEGHPLNLCIVRRGAPKPVVANRDAHALVEAALSRPGATGWARFRSATYANWTAPAFPSFADAGEPIAAEWFSEDGISSHLGGDPAHPGLLLRTHAERPAGGASALAADEQVALRQVVRVLAAPAPRTVKALGKGQATLLYHVYWGAPPTDPSAIRRLFSCFAGYTPVANRVLPKDKTP
jgi:hypothetical protein